jgi:hypothetical protein
MYYRIFYELWTFADFDRLCKLEKRGDEILKQSSLKLLSQSQPNFAEMILGWSNGGHLGYRTALTDTILKGIKPGTIPARFGLIWFNGFRGEDLNVILYQNMHNLHNMYSGFFCEIYLSADIYRLCKLGLFWWLLLLKIDFFFNCPLLL